MNKYLFILSVVLISSLATARGVQFSAGVPQAYQDVLRKDFLRDISLPDNPVLKRIMGINDLSDKTLKAWLVDRVGYLVAPHEATVNNLVEVEKNYKYENPGIQSLSPDQIKDVTNVLVNPNDENGNSGRLLTISENAGTIFYFLGKSKGVLLGFRFHGLDGTKIINITSPRVGILTLNNPLFRIPDPSHPASIVNSWYRVAAIISMGRYSDGNKKSLGFPATKCPPSRGVYAGAGACEAEGNGPYMIAAQILKSARQKCVADGSCNEREAELFNAVAFDAFSRVLSQDVLDPKPEGTIGLEVPPMD